MGKALKHHTPPHGSCTCGTEAFTVALAVIFPANTAAVGSLEKSRLTRADTFVSSIRRAAEPRPASTQCAVAYAFSGSGSSTATVKATVDVSSKYFVTYAVVFLDSVQFSVTITNRVKSAASAEKNVDRTRGASMLERLSPKDQFPLT